MHPTFRTLIIPWTPEQSSAHKSRQLYHTALNPFVGFEPRPSSLSTQNTSSAMGFKRKFDSEDSSAVAPDPDSFRVSFMHLVAHRILTHRTRHQMAKQLKQVPFPHSYQDEDTAMSEATPLYPDQAHSRFHSNASTSSTSSIDPSRE